MRRDDLTPVTEDQITELLRILADMIGAKQEKVRSHAGNAGSAPPQPLKAAELAPPSLVDLHLLLEIMPNPAEVDRDEYVDMMLAVQGCIRGGLVTGVITEADVPEIQQAAAAWAARWECACEDEDYELEKWRTDWSRRTSDTAGWRQLVRIAGSLGVNTSSWEGAAADFDPLPDEETPYRPEPEVAEEPLWDPWEQPTMPAFPANCLPPLLRDLATDTAKRLGTDLGATAMAHLTCIAAAVDGRTKIQVRRHDPEWVESPRLWTLLVGEPSAKKTPLMNAAVKPLRRAEADAAGIYELTRATWEQMPKGERGPEPVKTRYVVHDTTPESLGPILAGNPRGVLQHSDELAGLIGSLDRYSMGNAKGANAGRAFWLQAYNGGYHTVDRISRQSISIPNLSINILGGIQPAKLQEMTDLTNDGMMQRFLPVLMGNATAGKDIPLSPAVGLMRAHIAALTAMPERRLYLDNAGHRAREAAFARLDEMRQNADGAFGSFLGKADASLIRLALALWFADPASVEAGDGLLPAAAVEQASELLEYLIRHAVILYGTLNSRAQDENRQIASAIIRWKRDDIRLHEIVRNVRCCKGGNEPDNLKRVSVFVAHGWLQETGHPKTWLLAPGLREQFTKRAKQEQFRADHLRGLIQADAGGRNHG